MVISAENGGILRATNGNNSYGDFGTVAEGFDANETPKLLQLTIEAQKHKLIIFSRRILSVLALEYKNAGETYIRDAAFTQVAGTGLDARFEEYRQGAVNKIRLVPSNR